MGLYVITTQTMTFSGTDLTDHIESATIEVEADHVISTNFASAGWEEGLGGIKRYKLNITFQQDFADDEVYEKVFGNASVVALLGTSCAWTAKPTSASTSATNPQFSGNVIMTGGTLLGGAVGELAKASVTFPGTGALAVATT